MPSFDGFREIDFKDSIAGTTWRGRDSLGGVLTSALGQRTGREFKSWGIARRPQVFIEIPVDSDLLPRQADHRLTASHLLRKAKLHITASSTGLTFGFYVEKGFENATRARTKDEIMDETWHWHAFSSSLHGTSSQQIRRLVFDAGYRIHCWIESVGANSSAIWSATDGVLYLSQDNSQAQASDWNDFLDWISGQGDDVFLNFFLERWLSPEDAIQRGPDIADAITDTLIELLPIYDVSISSTSAKVPTIQLSEQRSPMKPDQTLIIQLMNLLRERDGLHFSATQLATYVTALQTKGFVILSGLSGTGKTKLAQAFARAINPDADGENYLFISVRPDWRDSSALIGYFNPLTGRYESTAFLRFLMDAQAGVKEIAAQDIGAWLRRRIKDQDFQQWARDFQSLSEDLAGHTAESLTSEQLHRLWHVQTNGVSSIGQAMSSKLPDQPLVTQATEIVMDLNRSVGQRYIDAVNILGTPRHWARVWRAMAAFDPEHVHTIVHGRKVRELLIALDYDHPVNPRYAARKGDAAAIDRSTQFLFTQVDNLISGVSRFERSQAAWELWTYFNRANEPIATGEEADPRNILPYIVVLDEMNLAHVEHYFADFLSILESGRLASGFSVEPIRLHNHEDGVLDGADNRVPMTLNLPPNLYFVGTVNVDETTHMFSPKVLDRAFTIEFDAANLASYPRPLDTNAALGNLSEDATARLAEMFTRNGSFARIDKTAVAAFDRQHPEYMVRLRDLEAKLRVHDLHFAYRTVDEILMFLANASTYGWFDGVGGLPAAFDNAVLMKVLPKFHGPRARLRDPLMEILGWADTPAEVMELVKSQQPGYGEAIRRLREQLQSGQTDNFGFGCPRVALKCLRMAYQLHTTGFTAFS